MDYDMAIWDALGLIDSECGKIWDHQLVHIA